MIWNTNKQGGWQNYYQATDNSYKLNNIAYSIIDDPTVTGKILDKELESIKFQAFGKVYFKKNSSVKPMSDKIFDYDAQL